MIAGKEPKGSLTGELCSPGSCIVDTRYYITNLKLWTYENKCI
nr:MAG TPA: hypothetical protein [Caudoviricetes sp.]